MGFTSSAVNKDNKFHIRTRASRNVLLVVRETLLFRFIETRVILIPAIPVDPRYLKITDYKDRLSDNMCFCLEKIRVDHVLCSTQKEDENLLMEKITGRPVRIISCSIKDISLVDKIIPLQQSKNVLAIAIYQYTITIRYLDLDGNVYSVNFNSGSRFQKIITRPFPGRLQVTADIQCIFSELDPE